MSDSNENPSSTVPSTKAAYSDLFERMLDPILLVSANDYKIVESNPACERVLGVEPDLLKGACVLDWVDQSTREEFEKALRVSMRRHHPRVFESVWTLPSQKTLAMEVLAGGLKLGEDEQVLQIIARDITFKKDAEKRLNELVEQLKLANTRLEELSTTDEMTGLNNYRYFRKHLENEVLRFGRYRIPFSLIFIDVDHFKKYNDRNGHPAGDQLLREVAKIMRSSVRNTDFPARYGGEEFAVLCPNTCPQDAYVLAERIRSTIAGAGLPHGEGQPLGHMSVSIGVSGCPDHGNTAENILELADQALYYAKSTTRDRVTIALSHPPVVKAEKKSA